MKATQKTPPMNRQRRSMLKTAQGAGLLAACAALFGGRHAAARALPASDAQPGDEHEHGYHETDHIRKYYAIARRF